MKFKKKIIQMGSSLGIILDKVVLNSLDLKKGDIVDITLKGGRK